MEELVTDGQGPKAELGKPGKGTKGGWGKMAFVKGLGGSSYLSGKNRKAGVQRSGMCGFATSKLTRTLAPSERGF